MSLIDEASDVAAAQDAVNTRRENVITEAIKALAIVKQAKSAVYGYVVAAVSGGVVGIVVGALVR